MCIIRYCGVSKSWWSTDGYKVKFRLAYPGWKFLQVIKYLRQEVSIEFSGATYRVGFFTEPDRFWIEQEIYPMVKPVDVFEIKRGHPAYDFFKKEMNRDGVVHLKPLDTPENWQSY